MNQVNHNPEEIAAQAARFTKRIRKMFSSIGLPIVVDLPTLIREIKVFTVLVVSKHRTGVLNENGVEVEKLRFSEILKDFVKGIGARLQMDDMPAKELKKRIEHQMSLHSLFPERTVDNGDIEEARTLYQHATEEVGFVRTMEMIGRMLRISRSEHAVDKFFSIVFRTINEAWKTRNPEGMDRHGNAFVASNGRATNGEQVNDRDTQERNVENREEMTRQREVRMRERIELDKQKNNARLFGAPSIGVLEIPAVRRLVVQRPTARVVPARRGRAKSVPIQGSARISLEDVEPQENQARGLRGDLVQAERPTTPDTHLHAPPPTAATTRDPTPVSAVRPPRRARSPTPIGAPMQAAPVVPAKRGRGRPRKVPQAPTNAAPALPRPPVAQPAQPALIPLTSDQQKEVRKRVFADRVCYTNGPAGIRALISLLGLSAGHYDEVKAIIQKIQEEDSKKRRKSLRSYKKK